MPTVQGRVVGFASALVQIAFGWLGLVLRLAMVVVVVQGAAADWEAPNVILPF